jgi:hypothetical protein
MNLARFKVGTDLKSRVDHSDHAHQNHETGGKEIHDELQGILEMKCADQGLDAEYEKKERKKAEQDHFPHQKYEPIDFISLNFPVLQRKKPPQKRTVIPGPSIPISIPAVKSLQAEMQVSS